MNQKTQKVLAGVLTVVVLVYGAKVTWNVYGWYDISKDKSEITSVAEYMRYYNALVRANTKDTVGFATPEETFDAFREALKAGDYELAASYFVPQKQKEMLESFKIGEKSGGVETLIGTLYLPNKKVVLSETSVRFRATDEVNGYSFSYDLAYNKANNIWKLIEL